MKVNGEIKEAMGFFLIAVGILGGFFIGLRISDFLPNESSWLKIILPVLACTIFALILMWRGFVLITKKYNQCYYSQRLKGYPK